MNVWDWAHQHPYALTICVIAICMGAAHIVECVTARWPR